MGKINWGRVFLGGLLAGLIINVGEFLFHAVIFKEQVAEMVRSVGKDPATVMAGNAIVIWNLLGFLAGIAVIWLYAAIRPRFGAGAKTAAIAAVGFWFIYRLLGAIAEMNMGMSTQSMILTGLVWGLVEMIIATVAGAWVYKEA
jgi:hypothetical protein